MIVTEADLRDQLRRPTAGARVTVPAGARLSPSATDFVKQWGLVVSHDGAVTATSGPSSPAPRERDWDKASTFPVHLAGEVPKCVSCGSPVEHKADALTQLNAAHYALKTHPRIRLRGQVDSLHAQVLLIQRLARQHDLPGLAQDLGTIAAYCRELTSAEYNERPVADLHLRDWDAERIHQATHDPRGVLGVEHLTIDQDAPELQHWLNLARADSRQIEITALEAFPSPHHPYGASICHAFNRLSSTFYFLQLRLFASERA